MTISSRAKLRRFWFLVHMWIGVGLFLLLIPISLTGSWLVWRPELDRPQHPARYAVGTGPAAMPVSAYLASAQAALGERARVASIRLPGHAGDPVTVQAQVRRGGRVGGEGRHEGARDGATRADADPHGGDVGEARSRAGANRGGRGEGAPRGQPRAQLTVWLDPVSGKVLDVANPRGGVSGFAHDLHGQLFVFGWGRQLVGWLGLLMLVSCLSGLWLWWPKAGPLTLGFRWRRGPGVLINLHYLTGFWVAVPLAVLSLTGALISFPDFTRAAIAMVAPVSPPQAGRGGGGPGRGGSPLGHTELTADQAAAAAIAAAGGGKLVSLNLPSRGPAPPVWRAQIARGAGPPANVAVRDAAEAAAVLQSAAKPAGGDQLIRLNRQIHGGDDTPLLWKLIITLAGVAPALLGITGAIVWSKSQLRKVGLRRPDAEGPEPVQTLPKR